MKTLFVSFIHFINDVDTVNVNASAYDVNSYEAKGLELYVEDENNSQVELDRDTMEEIEEEATTLLLELKETKDLVDEIEENNE